MWHNIFMFFGLVQTAHAATNAQIAAMCFVDRINGAILFPLITLLSAVAFIVFLWGGFQYIKNADNEQGRQVGSAHMLYGVIGLLVMLSAYAILSIAAGTFGLQGELSEIEGMSGGGACSAWESLRSGDIDNSGGNINNTGGNIYNTGGNINNTGPR
jgi:hypothetical protein